jgi:hypothetical protein
MLSGGVFAGGVPDIRVMLQASVKDRTVSAEVVIDPSRISFADVDHVRVALARHRLLLRRHQGRPGGRTVAQMELKLKDDAYHRGLKDGLRYAADIPVKGCVRDVKVVVYDYAADLLRSAVARVR